MPNSFNSHRNVPPDLEPMDSETEDLESSPASYEIVTYPADYTLEGLVTKYERKQLLVPGFQRNYIWSIRQASRLIESFLLGLPVPAIFLFAQSDNTQIVVDGQQRLLSIYSYFTGHFPPAGSTKRQEFALAGLNESSPYANKTYEDLRDVGGAAYNRLNDSVLRAFVIKQLNPKDNTSMFHIFERLNTGSTQLVGQEIRNVVYQGPFNDLLHDLNGNEDWRAIFGNTQKNKRMRDVELILRFLALLNASDRYERPMKDFLNEFMCEQRGAVHSRIGIHRNTFQDTMAAIRHHLGDKPFHLRAGINAAAFDSVSVAFGRNLNHIPADIGARYTRLKNDGDFLFSSGTTDNRNVRARLRLAEATLFGD